MHIEIIFDKRSSSYEKDNFETNRLFVEYICQYLNDLYKSQGYVYKEKIYTEFGFEWNPCDTNECLIYKQNGELTFEITTKEDKADKIWIDISSEK